MHDNRKIKWFTRALSRAILIIAIGNPMVEWPVPLFEDQVDKVWIFHPIFVGLYFVVDFAEVRYFER